MPSKKPKIVAYTENDILEKIKKIAQENERSISQEVVFLIKKEIQKYEKEYGEINIKQ